jgi:hypothetical protein
LYTAYWTSLGYLPGNAAYFSLYCFAKDRLQTVHNRWHPEDNNKNQGKFVYSFSHLLALWVSFVAGMVADVCAVFLYCPVEIVQQRLYLQDPIHKVYKNAPGEYMNTIANIYKVLDALCKIFKSDGIRGLYRGVFPLLLNSLPASAIWWTIYEVLFTFPLGVYI